MSDMDSVLEAQRNLAAALHDLVGADLARRAGRAERAWWKPLTWQRWELPFFLVIDLGVLLLRRDANLVPPPGTTRDYVDLLRRIAREESFRQCATITESTAKERQDETVRVAIQAMTRRVRAEWAKRGDTATGPDHVMLVANALETSFDGRAEDTWIGPFDLIAVRAASRLAQGPMLLHHPLLGECLRPWDSVPYHQLKSRRVRTREHGARDVCRLPGEIVGYTSLRPRMPTDPLHEILPTEWALMRIDRKHGLDKIINRQPLVILKETPHDLVPRLRVLVAFLLDAGFPRRAARRVASLADLEKLAGQADPLVRAKALTYRMILDAADQVPFNLMRVDVAVYVTDFESGHNAVATCFDLQQARLAESPKEQLLRFDELVPSYFYPSSFRSSGGQGLRGPHLEMSASPYVLLTGATAAVSTYSATLAVLFSGPGRWPAVLPGSTVPLRPVEVGRPAALLIESSAGAPARRFGCRSFPSLTHAQIGHALPNIPGSDVEARNAFLTMLLGPRGTAPRGAVAGPIVLDEARTAP